jgi:glycosyltransferase involved in cell wall biosynthesis
LPRFTVIIPSYNHARFLKQRIDSVLNQDFNDFEVIIIDDCSTDNSRDIIEQYNNHPKIASIIYNPVNSKNPFALWQKGIAMSKGDLIWVAESDDYCENTFLQTANDAFSQFPSIGIFYCDGVIYDEDIKSRDKTFSAIKNTIYHTDKWSKPYFEKGNKELNDYLKFDCTINNVSGMVFDKKIVEPFLSEASGFRYFGDWFYYVNICLRADVYYCNVALNTYRQHKTSHLNSSKEIARQRIEYFKILDVLLKSAAITNKRELLNHFAFYYLHPGVAAHGFKNLYQVLGGYFSNNSILALKIVPRLFMMKLFRRYYRTHIVKPIELPLN